MTMQTAKDNNMMWLALVIGGGILAYSTLRKDVVAITDNVVDGTKSKKNL